MHFQAQGGFGHAGSHLGLLRHSPHIGHRDSRHERMISGSSQKSSLLAPVLEFVDVVGGWR
jgi:hypothetical protein